MDYFCQKSKLIEECQFIKASIYVLSNPKHFWLYLISTDMISLLSNENNNISSTPSLLT